jgi:putative SOS response-associated peptidase YedK
MCGRFTLTWDELRWVAERLASMMRVTLPPAIGRGFNLAPTDHTSSSLRSSNAGRRSPLAGAWSTAEQETTAARVSASTPKRRPSTSGPRSGKPSGSGRGVVPGDGFYEWPGPKTKRQPLWIHPQAGGLILFARLYETWYPKRDMPEVTFTVVTCEANALIAEVHDRMPVILDERAAED